MDPSLCTGVEAYRTGTVCIFYPIADKKVHKEPKKKGGL